MLDAPNIEQGPSCIVQELGEGRARLKALRLPKPPATYIRAGEEGEDDYEE